MDSKLQIISGKWRGRKLNIPVDARPTQNRARMALFNMLESLGIRPNFVWDAFAGSGAFGIECLSRYDSNVIFTDKSQDSIKTIQSNLKNIVGKFSVEKTNAMDVIKKYGSHSDFIFIDPPYSETDIGMGFVQRLFGVVNSGTILIWEIENDKFEKIPDSWDILRDKKYGRARFLILKKA